MIGIVPVVPRGSPSVVILNFLSTNDARHFEGLIAGKRKNKEFPEEIKTQRWSVNSTALSDGGIHLYIQNEVVNAYNTHCEEAGKEEFKLQQCHIGMIKISTSKWLYQGKAHILMDFIDQCDQISCLLWYQGIDPFKDHDFSQPIPNPKTREKASTIPAYAEFTLAEKGLWLAKPRSI